jgi:hypothetical protein
VQCTGSVRLIFTVPSRQDRAGEASDATRWNACMSVITAPIQRVISLGLVERPRRRPGWLSRLHRWCLTSVAPMSSLGRRRASRKLWAGGGCSSSTRAVASLGFGSRLWRLQRADAWPRGPGRGGSEELFGSVCRGPAAAPLRPNETSKSIPSVVSHHKHSPAESSAELRVDPLPQPAGRKTARTRPRW